MAVPAKKTAIDQSTHRIFFIDRISAPFALKGPSVRPAKLLDAFPTDPSPFPGLGFSFRHGDKRNRSRTPIAKKDFHLSSPARLRTLSSDRRTDPIGSFALE